MNNDLTLRGLGQPAVTYVNDGPIRDFMSTVGLWGQGLHLKCSCLLTPELGIKHYLAKQMHSSFIMQSTTCAGTCIILTNQHALPSPIHYLAMQRIKLIEFHIFTSRRDHPNVQQINIIKQNVNHGIFPTASKNSFELNDSLKEQRDFFCCRADYNQLKYSSDICPCTKQPLCSFVSSM